MNILRVRAISLVIVLSASAVFAASASAYWVWTPDSKKFINPKYAVKDSPKEQYDWAMSFYDAKDYPRAATEFEKLAKQYEYSEYAGRAQYHVGLCYENMGKYYLAFQAYQKAIDNFPHLENVDEIVAREFNIAGIYAEKENPKVLGTDIMTPADRVVEIYRKVVDNAPYGKLADEALFKAGETLKTVERYDEAVASFQKIIDEYPNSPFTEKARYEVAYCAYKASLKPAYDQESTDKAIKAFSDFTQDNKDNELSKEADQTIQRLKDKAAEKSLLTAQFYEKIHKKESAIIYYQDILDRYPDSSYASLATTKIDALRNGTRRPAAAGEVVAKRGLFSIWPAKAPSVQPAAAAAMAPGTVAVAAPGAISASAPPAQAAAKPAKRSWMSFIFGKKEAKAVVPPPAAPVEAPPAAPAAPVTAAQAQSIVAGEAAWTMDPAVPIPLAPSAPGKLQVVKKRGWSPLGFLGLGGDERAPVQVAKAPQASPEAGAASLASEPVRAESAVASTDDSNVEKDTDGI